MANEIAPNERADAETGEIMTMTEQPLAVQLAQAELNQAVTTAKAFPRSIQKARSNILSLATLDEETAAECVYALPRGGKPIKGPSIRFAEIVASQWGNCHTGSRVVAVDKFDKVVVAEGVFFDLETGMKRTAQIRRRIVDSKGRLYNDDMITVTGNAAASVAMREAILKGIPKAVWRQAYAQCEGVIAGDIKTLGERRDGAIKAFAVWGIKPEQIFASLDVAGLDEIGLDQVATLRAMFKAIKDGDQKVEDYFPAVADQTRAADAAKGTAAKLADIAASGGKAANGEGDKAKPDSDNQKAESDKPKAKADNQKAEKAKEPPAEAKEAAAAKDSAQADLPATEQAGAEAQANQAAPDDDAPESFTDQQIEAAFQRGAEAKKKGMSRKATPPEWREPGKEELLNAWLRGFDQTERE